mgnify:CR=1 FL=1
MPSELAKFEAGLKNSDPGISPSMIYAYACLQEDVGYCNGAPNLTVDVPAIRELSALKKVPISGKDFKTGQTLMKTVIAPGLRQRMLGSVPLISSRSRSYSSEVALTRRLSGHSIDSMIPSVISIVGRFA